jgi:hypothetical protein
MKKTKWMWRIIITAGLLLLVATLVGVRAWADATGRVLNPLQWSAEMADEMNRQKLEEVFGERDAASLSAGNSSTLLDVPPNLKESARFDEQTGEITVLPERVEEPDLEGAPKVVPILEIPSPNLRGPQYVLVGEVKYEDVGGRGYLEMWTVVANPGAEAQIQAELDLQAEKVHEAEKRLEQVIEEAENEEAELKRSVAYVRAKNDLDQEKGILRAARKNLQDYPQQVSRKFFTRTLASSGPLSHLTGSSDWRPFALPFDAGGLAPQTLTSGRQFSDEQGPLPLRSLRVNVVLPDGGEVQLRDLRLLDKRFEGSVQAMLRADREKTLVQEASDSFSQAWGGASLRLVTMWTILTGGCLLVPLALAMNGQGRAIIVVLAWVYGLFSGVLLALGTLFLILGWPFGQFLPLLLCGVTGLILPLLLLPLATRLCEERELRKMTVRDAQSMI